MQTMAVLFSRATIPIFFSNAMGLSGGTDPSLGEPSGPGGQPKDSLSAALAEVDFATRQAIASSCRRDSGSARKTVR